MSTVAGLPACVLRNLDTKPDLVHTQQSTLAYTMAFKSPYGLTCEWFYAGGLDFLPAHVNHVL